jgi:hypothetical protein
MHGKSKSAGDECSLRSGVNLFIQQRRRANLKPRKSGKVENNFDLTRKKEISPGKRVL